MGLSVHKENEIRLGHGGALIGPHNYMISVRNDDEIDYSCGCLLRRDRRLALCGATLAPILSGAPAHGPQAVDLPEAEEAVLDTADGDNSGRLG